jgi:hypothetical protein
MLRDSLEMLEKVANCAAEDEPHIRVARNFAPYSAEGTKTGSVVCYLFQGQTLLGNQTDSAEGIAYIVVGTIETAIVEEKDQISSGEIEVIPVIESYYFHNIGPYIAKFMGFFSSLNVVSTIGKVFFAS